MDKQFVRIEVTSLPEVTPAQLAALTLQERQLIARSGWVGAQDVLSDDTEVAVQALRAVVRQFCEPREPHRAVVGPAHERTGAVCGR